MRIISGEARGRRLIAPRGLKTRPPLERIRESLFSILGDAVEGAAVLDLFAGAGAFGLEALSRGARRATFVERDSEALEALARNIRELGFAGRCRVLRGDAFSCPPLGRPVRIGSGKGSWKVPRAMAEAEGAESSEAEPSEGYGIIFVDPPFETLESPEGAPAVSRRLEVLIATSLCGGGILLLRLPARHRFEPEREPVDRRRFGESMVLLFEKG